MPQAKTEVGLQFSESCAAEVALQQSLFCGAEVIFTKVALIFTKSCAAASKKLQCNIEEAALQESGAFLPLSCGFEALTFRPPRLGPAERSKKQNLARMASRQPLFETLRKLFPRSAEGNSGKGLTNRNGTGGENVPR